MKVQVIIPFRDRGTDPLRAANVMRVVKQWRQFSWMDVGVYHDGRLDTADAQFNRSAAYNYGMARNPDADVYVFAESDMLIGPALVNEAIELAASSPGLVVPFTEYRYLGPKASEMVRGGSPMVLGDAIPPADLKPQYTMPGGRSIGAINVVSARTMTLVGRWDEKFEGNWYDDDAMKIAFEVCAGPTRWVEGSAHHLYHLPGHRGRHLTKEDRRATAANQRRLRLYEAAGRRGDESAIRWLTGGGS